MTKREQQLWDDLAALVAKHDDWVDDESWMKACNGIGAAYFAKIARQYDALDRFIEAMKLDYIDVKG